MRGHAGPGAGGFATGGGAVECAMSGFAQGDLFRQAAAPAPAVEKRDPMAELHAMLALVQGASALPWPHLPAAMEAEYRAMALAREAGEPGQALLAAFFTETERLLALTD